MKRKNNFSLWIVLLGASVFLASCGYVGDIHDRLTSSFKAQDDEPIAVGDRFHYAPKDAYGPVKFDPTKWWTQLQEPVLDALIARAIEKNPTLKIAEARILEARAIEKGRQAGLFPSVDANVKEQRENPGFFSQNKAYTLYDSRLDVQYEMDLFGKTQDRVSEAAALAQSEEANLEDRRKTLVAEVARAYVDFLSANDRLRFVHKSINSENQTYELTNTLLKAGVESNDSSLQSLTQLQRLESQEPELIRQRESAKIRLSTLLATSVTQVTTALQKREDSAEPLPERALSMTLTTPIQAIEQRADLRAARKTFEASLSNRENARKSPLPSLSLAGFYGLQNASSLPSIDIWNIAFNASLNLLDFGQTEAALNRADAQTRQAYYTWKNAVLQALGEIEGALNDYVHTRDSRAKLSLAAQTARKTEDSTLARYKAGLTALINVLNAQRNRYELEQEEVEARHNELVAFIRLQKALGH